MRLPRVRLRLWWLMVVVAILAVLLACFDAVVVVALGGMALVVITPAVIAPPGRRLEAASWAASLQPLMVLVYLYATWVTAWCVLGHRPRPYLDDPKYISPIVVVPYAMFFLAVNVGAPIFLGTGLILAAVCYARRSVVYPLLLLPFAWLAAYVALKWDPLWVLYWYMD